MIIEYYKKRNAKLKGPVCFYAGNGKSIEFKFQEPAEIEDQWGYKLLAEYADILRLVIPKAVEEKPKRKKKKAQKQDATNLVAPQDATNLVAP